MCQGVRPLDACGMRQLLRGVVSFANETTPLSNCLIPIWHPPPYGRVANSKPFRTISLSLPPDRNVRETPLP